MDVLIMDTSASEVKDEGGLRNPSSLGLDRTDAAHLVGCRREVELGYWLCPRESQPLIQSPAEMLTHILTKVGEQI